jgi:superfamily II DNA or RNA helicase
MQARCDSLFWLLPEFPADAADVRRLCARFTHTNPAYAGAKEMGASTKGIEPELLLWQEKDGWFGFPRTAVHDLALQEGWVYTDLRSEGRALRASEQVLKFRNGQQEAVADTLFALLSVANGTTLQADCGFGKTTCGVEVIRRLGRSTAVLVHKNFLATQWEDEVRTFIPEARVGRIQGNQLDTGDTHDVVICMVQSLLARDYPQEVFDTFGLLIADEVHRASAPEWQRAASMFPAKFRLGLTATPDRRDGLSSVFLSNFGEICHQGKAERLQPRLEVRNLSYPVDPSSYMMWRGGQRKPNVPKLINALVERKDRTARILRDIRGAVEAGRRVLVLSHRLEHVDEFVRALASDGVDVRKLVGGMTEAQQKYAADGDVIVGTFAMVQEGFDCPELDTLFLTTPQASVEQAVGRILRVSPDKKQPLVVDYVDHQVGICMGMFRARSRTYTKLGIERRKAA